MKIIVPMAGMGKRMRPHTLTVPKPLFPIAGKPIVERLIEGLVEVCDEKVEEIAFVIGDFGNTVIQQLEDIAKRLGAKPAIYYQEEALGTAHAILCAKDSLDGPVLVAFADTLFKADFKLKTDVDGIVWVSQIEDPSAFGVVKVDQNQIITDFVEKPKAFVSDLAIIGIYYFSDGERLKKEIQFLIDNDIKDKGEFQLTSALENMKSAGLRFSTGKVIEWLDCGNKDATVYTNQRILEFNKEEDWVSKSSQIENAVVVPPCYIGEDAVIKESVIGPYVSVGDGVHIERSIIKNAIVQPRADISGANIQNSIIGEEVVLSTSAADISMGDYSKLKNG